MFSASGNLDSVGMPGEVLTQALTKVPYRSASSASRLKGPVTCRTYLCSSSKTCRNICGHVSHVIFSLSFSLTLSGSPSLSHSPALSLSLLTLTLTLTLTPHTQPHSHSLSLSFPLSLTLTPHSSLLALTLTLSLFSCLSRVSNRRESTFPAAKVDSPGRIADLRPGRRSRRGHLGTDITLLAQGFRG